MGLYKATILNFVLNVSAFGDAVTAVLSWPACQSRNVGCLNGLTVLGSHLRSPVRSCRDCHHHWTKGELWYSFFYVNTTGGLSLIHIWHWFMLNSII